MAKKNREEIKRLFKNGLKPDEVDFSHIIDSSINFTDDSVSAKDGNIGINTTDPKATLHVYDDGADYTEEGTIGATLMVGNDSGLHLSMDGNEIMAKDSTNVTTLFLQPNGGDIRIHGKDDISQNVIIKDSGRVGIGTASPANPLHINTDSYDFHVTEEGKVGIGTSAPVAPLHIRPLGGKGGGVLFGEDKGVDFSDGGTVSKLGKKAPASALGTADELKILMAETEGVDGAKAKAAAAVTADGGKAAAPDGATGEIPDVVEAAPDVGVPPVISPDMVIGNPAGTTLNFRSSGIYAKSGAFNSSLFLNPFGGNILHGGTIVHTSDKRLKDNIKPLNKGLKEIIKLKPVSYKWKKETGNEQDLKYGFLAQDVEKVLKEIIYTNEESNAIGMSSIELIPVLVKSIQEQDTIIKKLEARMAKLEKLVQKK